MQARLYTIIATFLFAFFSTTCFADINWQSYSKNVFAKAKQEHKLVLIFGKAEWCPWCRKMKDNTYTDSAVISLVNKRFIPVRVDIDNDASLASNYDITVVPKTIILDENARTVDSLTGYIDSGAMLKFLQSNVK